MSHTPEPWVHAPQGMIVSMAPEAADSALIANLSPENAENARRIVACVNACEGSKTEDLERLAKDFIKPLIDLIDQRGQLLSAITEAENIAVESIRRMRATHVGCADLIQRSESLINTIRNAKGGE